MQKLKIKLPTLATLSLLTLVACLSSDTTNGQVFLDDVKGTVVEFKVNGEVYGHEKFDANGRDVTWQYIEGKCLTGTVEIVHGQICYTYPELGPVWSKSCYVGISDSTNYKFYSPEVGKTQIFEATKTSQTQLSCSN